MPNWCSNELIITGPKKKIDQCLRTIRGRIDGKISPLDLERIIPTPKELLDTTSPCSNKRKVARNIKKYDYSDWYSFRLGEWGTKGNCACVSLARVNSKKALLQFDTAWNPPKNAIEKLSKMFPDLEFYLKYIEEENMPYEQSITYNQGKLMDEEN